MVYDINAQISLSTADRLGHLRVISRGGFYMNYLPNGENMAAHDHNYLELAFFLGGEARHYSIGGNTLCRRGDILIIPVGTWHGYTDCDCLELINCLISPTLLEDELKWMADDPILKDVLALGGLPGSGEIRRLHVTDGQLPTLVACLKGLLVAYEKQAHQLVILGNLFLLLEQIRIALPDPKSAHRVSNTHEHPAVRRALEMVHHQLSHEWSSATLADRLRLNASYLTRLFRSHIGLPPMKYLTKLRAERAATLLLTSNLGIGKIGNQVGWPDPKQFARSFRQHFGTCASEYRKNALESLPESKVPPTSPTTFS